MAKTSMIEREKRRELLNKKWNKKRLDLKQVIRDLNASDEDRAQAELQLQALPRDSNRCRQRTRCLLCGRSRAVYRKVKLCRIHMRSAVMDGLVPGMRKASW
jgi:small subunit ribosomal protein S14